MAHFPKATLPFFCLLATGLCSAVPCLAAEPAATVEQEVILEAEPGPDGDAFADAEILPVPGGGTIFALRADSTSEPLYRFSLDSVNLYNLLGTLSQTLYDRNDTAATIRHGERLTIWDDSVRDRYIDISVDNLNLTATLDLVSLASNCNIFVTSRTIVVDQCD